MNALGHVPVDPALVERFRGDFAVALGRALAPDERIALAVSGGPDSMAMLALAAAAFPGRVIAATVDHGLRPAAADEAAMVAAYAAQIAVPHETLRIATPPGADTNVQAWARDRRYALLKQWAIDGGATCLLTAHHADDQAETFLMRAARGSGVAGLASIRAQQRLEGFSGASEVARSAEEAPLHPEGSVGAASATAPRIASIELVRPLLGWRVAELRALATAQHLPFVDDPSNVDPHYDRTRFRALLKATPWIDPVQIARSAAYAAEADATLREVEDWLRHTRTCADAAAGQTWLDIADLPRELKRRLCRAAIHTVRSVNGIMLPAFDDSANIESLLDSLEAGKAATHGGIMVTPRGNVWRFAQQPPRRAL